MQQGFRESIVAWLVENSKVHKSPLHNTVLNQKNTFRILFLRSILTVFFYLRPIIALYILHILPTQFSWYLRPNTIWWIEKIMNLLIWTQGISWADVCVKSWRSYPKFLISQTHTVCEQAEGCRWRCNLVVLGHGRASTTGPNN
jgi:hypothetical protein